jgi:hypothetical protein
VPLAGESPSRHEGMCRRGHISRDVLVANCATAYSRGDLATSAMSAAPSMIRPGSSLGREWAGRPTGFAWVAPAKSGIYQGFLASVVEAEPGDLTDSAGVRRCARETYLLQGFSSGRRLGERDQMAFKPPKAPGIRARKNPAFAGLLSGRPDLNRGPHRPELWAKSAGVVRSACKSVGPGASSPPLQNLGYSGRLPGFRQ